MRNQVYLSSEQFVDEMQKYIEGTDYLTEIPSAQRRPLAKPLEYYVNISSSRNEAIVQAYASSGYSMKALGEFFDNTDWVLAAFAERRGPAIDSYERFVDNRRQVSILALGKLAQSGVSWQRAVCR